MNALKTLRHTALLGLALCAFATHAAEPAQRSGGPFEGRWEDCEEWQGQQICSGYTLLQNGENLCGTWDYFATNAGYEGQLKARTLRKLTAQKQEICGSPGSDTSTPCESEYEPKGGWEPAQGYLMVCKGKLFDAKTESIQSCEDGYVHKPISAAWLKEQQNQPWMESCLKRAQ